MLEKQLYMGFIGGAFIITLINFLITYLLQPKEYHSRVLTNYLVYLFVISSNGFLLSFYLDEAVTYNDSVPAVLYNLIFYAELYFYFRFIFSAFAITKENSPRLTFFKTLSNVLLVFSATFVIHDRFDTWTNRGLYSLLTGLILFFFFIFNLYVFWLAYKKSRNNQSLRFGWYGQLAKILSLFSSVLWLQTMPQISLEAVYESTAIVIYSIGVLVEIVFFSISVNLMLKDIFQEKIIAFKEMEQLQNLSKMQIAELEERNEFIKLEEQKKLGRDLHDIVANSLATAKMQLYVAIQDAKEPALINKLQLVIDQLSESYYTIRSKSHLWYMGSIEEIAQKFVQKFNFLVTTSFPDSLYRKTFFLDETTIGKLSSAIQINVLLIIQEAITNILKHSNATEVSISLYEDHKAVLEIIDNGTGFDHSKPTNGVGFKSISERVEEIGGTLQIHSGKDGTEIIVLIPLID